MKANRVKIVEPPLVTRTWNELREDVRGLKRRVRQLYISSGFRTLGAACIVMYAVHKNLWLILVASVGVLFANMLLITKIRDTQKMVQWLEGLQRYAERLLAEHNQRTGENLTTDDIHKVDISAV